MKKRYTLYAALFWVVFFLSCNVTSNEEEPAVNPPSSLVGTCWWWPSLQLFFISDNRVMLYSTGSYYPNSSVPFKYTYPGPGYAYPYTYDETAKTGSIGDLGEYTGGALGDFTISPDNQRLDFTDYKRYGHSASFITVRPAPQGGYQFSDLPPGLKDTVWMGTIPGTSLGSFTGNPLILHFTSASQVYVTRTYDVDTDAEKQRFFEFSVNGLKGTIGGIGNFTIDATANTIAFADFPGAGSVACKRIQ
jgi:hypothetical protein